MKYILLDTSTLGTTVTVVLGIIGLVVACALIVYMKAGIARLTNTRYIDKRGKTLISPNTFSDINEFVGEKVSGIIKPKIEIPPIKAVAEVQTKTSEFLPYVIYSSQGTKEVQIGNVYKGIMQLDRFTFLNTNSLEFKYNDVITLVGSGTLVSFKVIALKIFSERYQTEKGIRVGDTVGDIFKVYGQGRLLDLAVTTYISYDGISFVLSAVKGPITQPDNSRKIEYIIVKAN